MKTLEIFNGGLNLYYKNEDIGCLNLHEDIGYLYIYYKDEKLGCLHLSKYCAFEDKVRRPGFLTINITYLLIVISASQGYVHILTGLVNKCYKICSCPNDEHFPFPKVPFVSHSHLYIPETIEKP